MADYIFCMRKKNNPRIDVRICQKKCPFKDECPEFLDYQRNSIDQSSILNSRLIVSPLLNPMASKNWRKPQSRQFKRCILYRRLPFSDNWAFLPLTSWPHHQQAKQWVAPQEYLPFRTTDNGEPWTVVLFLIMLYINDVNVKKSFLLY